MDTITRSEFSVLLEPKSKTCVSIYLPRHPSGPERQKDEMRLHTLLREAGRLLCERGLAADQVETLMAPADELARSPALWRQPWRTLALFVAPETCHFFRLDEALPEQLTVGDRFVVRPLLPGLSKSERFYLLALSRNQVRLLEASHSEVKRIELPGVPRSMEETLGYTGFVNELQAHSTGPARFGHKRGGGVHGHGDGDEERLKTDLLTYFQRLSKSLRPFLVDPHAPIVLASVASNLPLFRRACGDARLLPEAIEGNPDQLTDQELAERALPIVQPWLNRSVEREIERFEGLARTPKTAAGIEEVLAAARDGRVETLLLHRQAGGWGRFDRDSGAVEVHTQPRPGDEDLLETAALFTLSRGGQVFALEDSKMPRGRVVAANLRY